MSDPSGRRHPRSGRARSGRRLCCRSRCPSLPGTTTPPRCPRLSEPLHHWPAIVAATGPQTWGLVVHDWSLLSYPTHPRKTDQAKVNHGRGYELTTLLLVEGNDGQPVAPLEVRLRRPRAVFSIRRPTPAKKAFRIDEVLPSHAGGRRTWGWASVWCMSSTARPTPWRSTAPGRRPPASFLVRAKGRRLVRWRGEELSLAKLAARLPLRRCQEVRYKGQKAVQHVAEAEVVLDRPAWRHRRASPADQRTGVPGPPITLRLVVSRVCDSTGQTLAVWYLLTNLPAEVDTATVALWYYWRWRIESLFTSCSRARVSRWSSGNSPTGRRSPNAWWWQRWRARWCGGWSGIPGRKRRRCGNCWYG